MNFSRYTPDLGLFVDDVLGLIDNYEEPGLVVAVMGLPVALKLSLRVFADTGLGRVEKS